MRGWWLGGGGPLLAHTTQQASAAQPSKMHSQAHRLLSLNLTGACASAPTDGGGIVGWVAHLMLLQPGRHSDCGPCSELAGAGCNPEAILRRVVSNSISADSVLRDVSVIRAQVAASHAPVSALTCMLGALHHSLFNAAALLAPTCLRLQAFISSEHRSFALYLPLRGDFADNDGHGGRGGAAADGAGACTPLMYPLQPAQPTPRLGPSSAPRWLQLGKGTN